MDEASSAGEEDLKRWENMYYQREEEKGQSEFADSLDVKQGSQTSQIRVLSFDLDNTIWKTSATIDAANDALAKFLEEKNVVQTRRVEKVMGDLFTSNKPRYCPIDTDKNNAPVLLTLLRKDAIRHVLEQEENGYTTSDAVALSEAAFELWVKARHDSITSNLADHVVETLTALSEMKTMEGHPVKIGAVTDGNSNPDLVDCLSGFFDFIVNAEQVGVAKPDKRIYLRAAQEVLSSNSQFSDLLFVPDGERWPDEFMEDVIGPWWVHVGDDFVKDIVAGKALNMRTIWVKELVQGKVQKVEPAAMPQTQQRTVETLVKEVSQMKVVKMEVGADDYLEKSLQGEFADAVVERFANVVQVVSLWQQDAVSSATSPPNEDLVAATTPTDADIPSTAKSFKFCMNCGAKIPAEARFCPSCGEPQQAAD